MGYKVKRVDTMDEWLNSAYTEDGDIASCPDCGCDMKFGGGSYYCPDCGTEMSRSRYFDYIGADRAKSKCYSCSENYPRCRRNCSR